MYRLDIADDAAEQLAALPHHALVPAAELMSALSLAPGAGIPYHAARPNGTMFTITFGPHDEGLAIYEIVEEDRWVSVLRVFWVE